MFAATGKSPILSTQVQGIKNENGVQITEQVAPQNDLLAIVTRGLINPLQFAQAGFSR